MSNTITLPRADWDMLTNIVDTFMNDYGLRGGSLECVLNNINTQLDKQEY
jgi:hypothetical protein